MVSVSELAKIANKFYLNGRVGEKIAQCIKNINRIIFACDIAYQVKIPENIKLPHQGVGLVIGPGVILGNNCKIYHNVTLGAKDNYAKKCVDSDVWGKKDGFPRIGDNVLIGTGACVLGNIKIGNNVIIGANSVVLSDVPDNVVVAGNPAKVIKYLGE